MCEVDKAFIEDPANMCNLEDKFDDFQKTLNVITDYQSQELLDCETYDVEESIRIKENAPKLYLIIH